jgi:hypothetical protein
MRIHSDMGQKTLAGVSIAHTVRESAERLGRRSRKTSKKCDMTYYQRSPDYEPGETRNGIGKDERHIENTKGSHLTVSGSRGFIVLNVCAALSVKGVPFCCRERRRMAS